MTLRADLSKGSKKSTSLRKNIFMIPPLIRIIEACGACQTKCAVLAIANRRRAGRSPRHAYTDCLSTFSILALLTPFLITTSPTFFGSIKVI
jgi:hypothetical protein